MALVEVKESGANYTDEQHLAATAEVARLWFDQEKKQIQFSIDVGEKDHYLDWSFDIQEFMEAMGKAVAESEIE